MGFVSNLQDVMITFANVPPDIQVCKIFVAFSEKLNFNGMIKFLRTPLDIVSCIEIEVLALY